MCQEDGRRVVVYIFGGQALILRGIIDRPTVDIDIFTRSKRLEVLEGIKTLFKEDYGIEFDIGYEGRFRIVSGDLTWILPKGAYERAEAYWAGKNLTVFLLHPLDVFIMKCYRLDEKDVKDIVAICRKVPVTREMLVEVFGEYFALVRGSATSKGMLKENFENLALVLFEKYAPLAEGKGNK